ncbi:MAG: hypothetical protein CL458_05715 [Acidimicrobiaceae bacterium]|jgi:hypothetical protein|nr:hypothetical protein [Acidimicrobiaceae bacterium]|tara:strand:- start:2549 stop:2908 length:360 start_codon:yes stop_codon:yes gene_type:complete
MMLGKLHLLACWVLVVGNGAAGAWSLTAIRFPKLQNSWLWRFTACVQIWVLVQVTLAATYLNAGEGEAESFHVFYGVLSAVTVAVLYSYRSQLSRYLHALYGWGGLFIMGLGIRALVLL